MQRNVLGMIAVVLIASMVPAAAVAAEQENSAYAGSTVSFDAEDSALVDYTVDGSTMAESVAVQSRSEAESALSLSGSADLRAVANLTGAALSVETNTETSSTIRSDSGATLRAHDNGQGSLVVEGDGEAQYVEVGLGADASASAESDSRVTVTSADGTEGAFVVAGEGSVTVNEQGNVSADVGSDGRLVFRSYPDGRTDADASVEGMIESETAAASVHLTGEGTDVVTYDGETSVTVEESSEGNVSMAVERASSQGKVVLTSVAEGTFESAEDVQVTVDGDAAVEASSYSELEAAATDGDSSKFMVQQATEASAQADVLVGIDHFSTREVTMSDSGSSGDGSSNGANGGNADTSSGNGPGFGAIGALLALGSSVAVLAHRRG